jgi:hypothetical protein
MKNIIWLFSAIIMMVCGIQNISDSKVKAGSLVSVGKSVLPLGDNDPIIMRSHVRNTGGYPIAGAAVSLILTGTSIPQYTGTTNSSGDYTFDAVDQGAYTFRIAASGYNTKNVGLTLTENHERTDTLVTN